MNIHADTRTDVYMTTASNPPTMDTKATASKLRCAIYTRKSSEEGLEQDFNSLDAQREACEAYIAPQSSLRWKLVSKAYDDGGISGGTMKRPALQEFLEDISKGLVDVIVVYKIDRLTRSLMDFARMVDIFDGRGVSFVSVTQQFNTTTSMGRLTLNVLLSFAQFEREVTGERIRDKIAASKKKGMWMGGKVPLGYKVEDRKLLIEPKEAETVRYLFRQYLELGSVTKLVEDAKANGLAGRVVHQKNGIVRTTKPFGRGNLYHLLSSPIYIGKVTHKHEIYEGQHAAIIDQELWDKVQAKLKTNSVNRRLGTNTKSRNLLTSLIFDEAGNRLTTSNANKKGVRYSYYVSTQKTRNEKHESNSDNNAVSCGNESEKVKTDWRIPAQELDQIVLKIINDNLTDPIKLGAMFPSSKLTIEQHQTFTRSAGKLVTELNNDSPAQQRKLLSSIIKRVELHYDKIALDIRINGLVNQLGMDINNLQDTNHSNAIHRIEVPYQLKKRGVEAKLIIGQAKLHEPKHDQQLIMFIAKAHDLMNKLKNGSAKTIAQLAETEPQSASQISRMLQFTFLAPDIIESILTGTQPADLTAENLRRLSYIPHIWNEQKELLGFAD